MGGNKTHWCLNFKHNLAGPGVRPQEREYSFPRGSNKKPNDSKIKKASSTIIAPCSCARYRQKLSRSEKVGMSWCVGQGVPVLHGIRFVDGSHEQHVVLCSTFDMCVRDWVLCAKYVVMRVRLLALRGDDCASEDVRIPLFQAPCRSNSGEGGLTRGHDDDNQQDDNADDDTDAHLHVLPPHLLAHAVGAAAEALRGRRQVVGLILQGVEALAALRGFAQVLLHLGHGAVDLLFVTKHMVSSVVLLVLRD